MTRRTTRPLGEFGRADLAVAGGKGAALGELVRQGLPVPPGFIITTDAYRTLFTEAGLGAALDGIDQNTPDGGTLRALIARRGVSAALRAEIGEAYAAMGAERWRSVPARLPKTCPAPHSPASRTRS